METDVAIDEEILADQFEDTAKRTGLLQNIVGKDRGLIERVVQWLKDTIINTPHAKGVGSVNF